MLPNFCVRALPYSPTQPAELTYLFVWRGDQTLVCTFRLGPVRAQTPLYSMPHWLAKNGSYLFPQGCCSNGELLCCALMLEKVGLVEGSCYRDYTKKKLEGWNGNSVFSFFTFFWQESKYKCSCQNQMRATELILHKISCYRREENTA